MRIGVISDTHIPNRRKELPQIVFDVFQDVDHIIHAGDLSDMGVILELETLAPVSAVSGNVDSIEIQTTLGTKKILTYGMFKIGVFHGHGTKGKTIDRVINAFKEEEVHCIVFGHSHIPFCEYVNNILLFNPGSPTDKRRSPYYSIGIIEINETIDAKFIFFDKEGNIKNLSHQ